MDLGITNIFIFYLRSWLILSTEISQPSFDHRLTLAIYLTALVWVNQYKRNREFGSIHSSKFHDTFHVSKNLIYKLRTSVSRVSSLFTQLNKDTPPVFPHRLAPHAPTTGPRASAAALITQNRRTKVVKAPTRPLNLSQRWVAISK